MSEPMGGGDWGIAVLKPPARWQPGRGQADWGGLGARGPRRHSLVATTSPLARGRPSPPPPRHRPHESSTTQFPQISPIASLASPTRRRHPQNPQIPSHRHQRGVPQGSREQLNSTQLELHLAASVVMGVE